MKTFWIEYEWAINCWNKRGIVACQVEATSESEAKEKARRQADKSNGAKVDVFNVIYISKGK